MNHVRAALEAAGCMAVLFALIYAPNWWPRVRAWLDTQVECRHEIAQLFPDPHTTRWPSLCAAPPCDLEDGWTCAVHRLACPRCTDVSLCAVHDPALWEELERRIAQ